MIKINLLPQEVIIERENAWKKMIPVCIFFVLLAIFIGMEAAKLWEIRLLNEQIYTVESHLDANKEISAELDAWKKQKELINKSKSAESTMLTEKVAPSFMLDQFTIMLPQDMWFDSINLKGKVIEIRGSSLSYNSLAIFLSNLNASKYFVVDPSLIDSGITDHNDSTVDKITDELNGNTENTKATEVINFTITGKMVNKEVETIESKITKKPQPEHNGER